MLLGMIGVFLGYQTFWLGAFAKIHGWTSGLLPEDTFARGLFKHVNLERGLIAGAALVVTGLGLCLWLLREWWGQNLGTLDVQVTFRVALWGFLCLVLGVQTIFSSFFLSMLGMTQKAQQL
jgi:hypothetical protein